MAYEEALAERIRTVLSSQPEVREQKMFGGIAFMVREHMTCGVMGPDLLVRLGAEGASAALDEPGVREFDFTGRPMSTTVVVGGEALGEDDALRGWLERAVAYTGSLPSREPKGAKGPRRRRRM